MRLRSRRRDLVVWRLSNDPADRYGDPRLPRPVRRRRMHRVLRLGTLLAVVGAMALARGVRHRWRPVTAGLVQIVIGVVFRGGAWGAIIMPGLWFLLYALLSPAGADVDPDQQGELEREVAGYSTAAERSDFVATLNRYPDEVTHKLRDILHSQAMTACSGQNPGSRRR